MCRCLLHMPHPIGSFNYSALCGDPGNVPTCDVSNVTTLNRVFYGEANFNGDVSSWSVGSVTDVQHAFHGATTFNINLNAWDVSSTTDMAYAFAETATFNQHLGAWVTSSITSLDGSFHHAAVFNQPLASWNTRSVTSLDATFYGARAFNQQLDDWDISGVTTLAYTFGDPSTFNQPLASWNTRSVTSLDSTFYGAWAFNQQLDDWDISGVTNFAHTFREASAFNQPLASWNTRSVTTLQGTFRDAAVFNQPLNDWDISGVITLTYTFRSASAYNQPLASWITGSVTSLDSTFHHAAAFNQPLNNWNVSSVTSFVATFSKATSFDQDLSRWTLSRDGLFMSTMFHETNLSTCNKASMRNEWGAKQKNPVFLESYGFWPQQCLNNNDKCQAWQKRGIGDDAKCEPALWLDASSCTAHVWNGTRSLNEGQVGNTIANSTARQEWASPFLDHTPDQVPIKHDACTHLPGLSQAFKHSMDPAVERFGQHLRSKLKEVLPLGDNFGHNLDDGVSALVQFDERSSDLFVIRLMASSIDNSCASSLAFTDGPVNVPLDIATAVLSLKNISFFSSQSASECHGTEWTSSIGLPEMFKLVVEDAFAQAGRQPGEPQFALSRFPPDYTRKRNDTAPPTLTCPLYASLVWPFKLSAVIRQDDPDEEHVFQVLSFFCLS